MIHNYYVIIRRKKLHPWSANFKFNLCWSCEERFPFNGKLFSLGFSFFLIFFVVSFGNIYLLGCKFVLCGLERPDYVGVILGNVKVNWWIYFLDTFIEIDTFFLRFLSVGYILFLFYWLKLNLLELIFSMWKFSHFEGTFWLPSLVIKHNNR